MPRSPKCVPRPVVNLFGGEPTVRNDMFEIIEIGRKHGVDTQITTNGVRLADKEYCRKLCEAQVGLRLSFDGRHREIYQRLRNDGRVFDQKMKALENLKKYSRRKHTIIVCAALGINDQYLADLIQFCYENRTLIADLGIIPLYESWEPGVFHVARRTTAEDVEKMVQAAVPGGGVDFIPAGMTYWLRVIRPFFRDSPAAGVLLFAGVHANCESVTFLIPNGESYGGLNHYLHQPLPAAAKELADRIRRIQPRLALLDPKKPFQRLRGKFLCLGILVPWLLGAVNLHRVFGDHLLLGMLQSAWRLWQRRRTKRRTKRPRRLPTFAWRCSRLRNSIRWIPSVSGPVRPACPMRTSKPARSRPFPTAFGIRIATHFCGRSRRSTAAFAAPGARHLHGRPPSQAPLSGIWGMVVGCGRIRALDTLASQP